MIHKGMPICMLLILAACLSAFPLWSQNLTTPLPEKFPPSRLLFKSFGVEQGLENSGVRVLAQDFQGFLWVGTESGLLRYDGNGFQTFTMKEGLPSGHIRALLPMPDASLYVGTWQGLVLRRHSSFIALGPEVGLPRVRINHLALGSRGRVWVGTSQGLFVSNGSRFMRASGWSEAEVLGIWAHPDRDELWCTSGSELFHGTSPDRWERFGHQHGLGSERLDAVLQDPKGRLYVRSTRSLWVKEPGKAQFEDVSAHLPSGLRFEASLHMDARGVLWIPTESGLAFLDQGRWGYLGVPEGLPATSPRAVLVDRQQMLWMGGQGLFRSLGSGQWRAYTSDNGLPHSQIWTVFRDREGRLWAGTHAGLAEATPRGWKRLAGTENLAVRTVAQGRDGAFWIGGNEAQIFRWDPRKRTLQRFGEELGLRGNRILKLLFDGQGKLWIATDGGGLFSGEVSSGKPHLKSELLPGGRKDERVSHLLLDRENRLWVCAEVGLACFQNGQWTRFSQAHGLRQEHVAYLLERRDGSLAAAYFEPLGLTYFRATPRGLQILGHLDSSRGLESDKVYLMGEDSRSRFWVGTGKGVDVFDGNRVRHYGRENGLPGDDCDAMAFWPEADGQVWIGTSTGLGLFLGGRESEIPAPSVALLSARASGQPLNLHSDVPLRLDRRGNSVEFRFAGLDYAREIRTEYQYRLLGQDEHWRRTQAREAHFAALDPGHYRFEVQARIKGGDWGAPASLAFELVPAWWQRLWIRLLLMGAVLAYAVRFISQRIKILKRRNLELEVLLKLADSLTQELERANLILQEQSLTDPLTGLKNRRYLQAVIAQDIAQVERQHHLAEENGEELVGTNIDMLFIMVDLDHFKLVNDNYGHAAGDAVLQQTADILRSATRGSDTVIRWGGEEFLIVARQTRKADAVILAERIRANLARHHFLIPGDTVLRKTCSVGFAPYPVGNPRKLKVGWEQVIDFADQCLYQAKEGGRDRWVGLMTQEASPEQFLPLNGRPVELQELLKHGLLSYIESEERTVA